MPRHRGTQNVNLGQGTSRALQLVIGFGVTIRDRQFDRPESDYSQEAVQAGAGFRGILAQDDSDKQFAQHRNTGAKDTAVTMQLLDTIANNGNPANRLSEVIGVE
jgi:hypothetical protein